MLDYYHIYPTCPHCLEPNYSGSIIQEICHKTLCQNCKSCYEKFCPNGIYKEDYGEIDKLYYCNSCGTVFNKYIDISNFDKTCDIISREDNNIEIPLIWKINLNDIEKDYINWIDKINGKFLITWPWEEVKFIPILVHEYLKKYKNSKIVLIDDFFEHEDITKPNAIDLFEHLIYSKETSLVDSNLKDEYNRFSYKDIFKKVPKFHYHINIKKNDFGIPQFSDDFSKICINSTLNQYHKEIIDEIRESYGVNSIKIDLVEGKQRKTYINDDGFIHLKFDKQFSWSGKNYKFNNYQLWENICNINNFHRVKNEISHVKIFSDEHLDFDENTQLFFVSSEFDNLFDIIDSINPNLVIFLDSDEFIKDFSIFYSKRGKDFNNFIMNSFSDCLLFSLNKDIRHLYGFNDENGFISKGNIQIHTWDSDLILSELDSKDNLIKTAGSSSLNDLDISKEFDVDYQEVSELNEFEVLIEEIFEETGNQDYKKFLSRMSRSPLLVYSDFNQLNFEMFNSLGLDFEKVLINLENSFPELYSKLSSIYLEIYENDANPLINYFDNIINEQKQKGFNKIKLVLYNKYEVSKFKKVMKFKGIDWDDVEILHWNQLDNLDDTKDVIILSSSYPHITYDMYRSNFKEFIFVGGKSFIEDAKAIIENRIDAKKCRPVSYNEDNYPPLLRGILSNLNIPKMINIVSEEIYEDSTELLEDDSKEVSQSNLNAEVGESVLLLINKNNEALFIPFKYNMMYKHPRNLVDVIDLNEKNYSKLKNKEIILNNHEFIVSFKEIFARFLLENGDGMEVISETHKWDSFYDLFNSAYDWRNELYDVIPLINKNKSPVLYSEEILAYDLSKSGIYAKDSNYIRQFWLTKRRKYIRTSQGVLNLYDIEKPKGQLKDLIKIFEVISKFNPKVDVQKRALRNYIALRQLLKLRRNFLKGKNIDPVYQHLYIKFRHELELMIKKQNVFKVLDVRKITLKKSVRLFKIINNFQEYYE